MGRAKTSHLYQEYRHVGVSSLGVLGRFVARGSPRSSGRTVLNPLRTLYRVRLFAAHNRASLPCRKVFAAEIHCTWLIHRL